MPDEKVSDYPHSFPRGVCHIKPHHTQKCRLQPLKTGLPKSRRIYPLYTQPFHGTECIETKLIRFLMHVIESKV